MDTEVKSLANIKAMEGRNLDSSVDENTLVSGEKADGTFGVFNFFKGIRNFFKGISALGTLASGSRLPVTDANGNVTYTTMNDINSYVINNALTDYPKKTNYTYCKSNDIVRITDSPSLTEDKYYLLQEFSVTWQGIQKIEILLGYDANYEKTRVILTLDNRYANNPRVISYYDSPQGLNYVDFFVSNDGNKTYLYARGFKGKNYITFIILDRNFSLKSNYNVPSNSYIGNVIHTVSTNGGKIVTDKDLKNITFSDTTHNFGNASTTSEVFAEFDLSSYKENPCAYIGVLRCGGASNKSYSFTFTLVVSYGTWSFVENSKSYQGGSLTFDPSTSKLRMTLTDKTIGLYEDKLTLLKIQ